MSAGQVIARWENVWDVNVTQIGGEKSTLAPKLIDKTGGIKSNRATKALLTPAQDRRIFVISTIYIELRRIVLSDDEFTLSRSSDQFEKCFLYLSKTLKITLKFSTAEIRILNINDDESRNVMFLKILKILQNMIEHNCSIQNLFDLTFEINSDISLFKTWLK